MNYNESMVGKIYRLHWEDKETRQWGTVVGRLDNFAPNGIVAIYDEVGEVLHVVKSQLIVYLTPASKFQTQIYQEHLKQKEEIE